LLVGGADRLDELAEEVAAPGAEHREQLGLDGIERCGCRHGQGELRRLGEVQAQPAVVAREGAGSRPDDLARGGEFVEHVGPVVGDACREHECLPRRGGNARTLELLDHGRHPVDAAEPAAHMLPLGKEPRVLAGHDRFDLVAQHRERPAPQPPEHLAVAPLRAAAAW
jgi:hypothetical protein